MDPFTSQEGKAVLWSRKHHYFTLADIESEKVPISKFSPVPLAASKTLRLLPDFLHHQHADSLPHDTD